MSERYFLSAGSYEDISEPEDTGGREADRVRGPPSPGMVTPSPKHHQTPG